MSSCHFLLIQVLLATLTLPITGQAPEAIPEGLLNFRFGPRQYILVAEKSTQKLYIYSTHDTSPVEVITITSGKTPGNKREEGDMKTPEGIYLFTRQIDRDDLPKVDDYGDRAFTMNYPNPVDREEGRSGSGIWLHGAHDPGKVSDPTNSRGCVVMQNRDLMRISRYIFLNQTPILIYNTIPWQSAGELEQRREWCMARLKSWKNAWESKDIDAYIEHYHPAYRDQSMDLGAFRAYKKKLNGKYRYIRVYLSDISFCSHQDQLLCTFNQFYVSDLNEFYSRKTQYWKKNKGVWKIVDEQNRRLPTPDTVEVSLGNRIPLRVFRARMKQNPETYPIDQIQRATLPAVPPQTHPEEPTTPQEDQKQGPEWSSTPPQLLIRRLERQSGEIRLLVHVEQRGDLRIIPVLLVQDAQGSTQYQSLPDLNLDRGIPTSYRGGQNLRRGDTALRLPIRQDLKFRSLTCYITDDAGTLLQILSVFTSPQTP